MELWFVLIAILSLTFSALHFFAPDVVWSVDQFFNDMKGVVSKRTDAWEFGRKIRGVFFLIVGIAILVLARWAATVS